MEQRESDRAAEAAAGGDHSVPDDRMQTVGALRARQQQLVDTNVLAAADEGLGAVSREAERAMAFRREEYTLMQAFTYHAPTPAQTVSLQRINEAAHALAHMILLEVPPCADRTAAIRLVREARMTANAGIVLDGAI